MTVSTTTAHPRIVNEGDAVFAEGNLFETDDPAATLLCAASGWIGDIGCIGTVVVPVQGVDVRDYPGSVADPHVPDLPRGTRVTSWLRVTGVWSDGVLQARHVDDLAERPSLMELMEIPEVPCDPPPGGWAPGSGVSDPGHAESAWAELEAEITSHPDTYSGTSSAIRYGPDGKMVGLATVVGTVVDVETVEHKLKVMYPYNLCVVRVDHSAAELQATAAEVRALKRPWEVLVHEYGFGRVLVRVPVLDQDTAATLASFGSMVRIQPVVALADVQ